MLQACSPDPVPQVRALSGDAVILAFGDSLTYGSGVAENQSYPAILHSLIGRKIVNAGISGETSAEGLQRLPWLIKQTKPDLMVLIHGGNDLLGHQSEAVLKQNLAEMIVIARQNDVDVVMLSVPKPTIFLRPAKLYAELAREQGIAIDQDTLSDVLSDRQLKSDQIHPNAAGYKKMANSVRALLSEAGAL